MHFSLDAQTEIQILKKGQQGKEGGKHSLILRRHRLWTNLLALMYSSKRGRATK